MARIVIKKDSGPIEVKKDSWICRCGLSKNQPYCDSSHKRVADEEDKTYLYNDKTRAEVSEIHVSGHGCACGHDGACEGCGE